MFISAELCVPMFWIKLVHFGTNEEQHNCKNYFCFETTTSMTCEEGLQFVHVCCFSCAYVLD